MNGSAATGDCEESNWYRGGKQLLKGRKLVHGREATGSG